MRGHHAFLLLLALPFVAGAQEEQNQIPCLRQLNDKLTELHQPKLDDKQAYQFLESNTTSRFNIDALKEDYAKRVSKKAAAKARVAEACSTLTKSSEEQYAKFRQIDEKYAPSYDAYYKHNSEYISVHEAMEACKDLKCSPELNKELARHMAELDEVHPWADASRATLQGQQHEERIAAKRIYGQKLELCHQYDNLLKLSGKICFSQDQKCLNTSDDNSWKLIVEKKKELAELTGNLNAIKGVVPDSMLSELSSWNQKKAALENELKAAEDARVASEKAQEGLVHFYGAEEGQSGEIFLNVGGVSFRIGANSCELIAFYRGDECKILNQNHTPSLGLCHGDIALRPDEIADAKKPSTMSSVGSFLGKWMPRGGATR